MLTRRGIIGSLGALLAAPAVVKVASLMPVRGIIMTVELKPYGNLITLEEYAKGFGRESYRRSVIEMFSAYSDLFEVMPMDQVRAYRGPVASFG